MGGGHTCKQTVPLSTISHKSRAEIKGQHTWIKRLKAADFYVFYLLSGFEIHWRGSGINPPL